MQRTYNSDSMRSSQMGATMYSENNALFTAAQVNENYGILQVQVVCELGARPVEYAQVQIYNKYDPDTVILDLTTDASGKTKEIELPAPPIEYSMVPSANRPYAEYRVVISAPGLQTVVIDSTQLLPYVKTIQPIRMPRREMESNEVKLIYIGPHFLYGDYPPKIYEAEVKDNFISSEPLMIPESILVHDGLPDDSSATNYTVDYRDYIKNVVSCQIYGNWIPETIYANILARLSFSLNRIYTNWYKNQGYDFTITSSTEYDQLWIYGRNIDSNISLAVDYIFNYLLSRPEITQPILTQACTGIPSDCPGMLSLWGSKFLGDQSYKAIDILRYYYGEQIYINSTDNIEGILPWPQGEFTEGSTSEAVRQLQEKLTILSRAYNEIPLITEEGLFGEETKNAVMAFQKIFDLPVTGIVDAPTWYKISQMYNRLINSSNLCQTYT